MTPKLFLALWQAENILEGEISDDALTTFGTFAGGEPFGNLHFGERRTS